MPQNKRFLFNNNFQQTAAYAQALCHPARLSIIEELKKYDFLTHKDICQLLPLSTGSISQHLSCLLSTKIVIQDELADTVGYRLNHIGWQTAKSTIGSYFSLVG